MSTLLAETLRTATRAEHEQAEHMPFVGELMAGRLPLDAYVDLLGQHHTVYGVLEAAEPFVRADPAGRSLVVDGLARTAAIEADLATLRGPGWRAGIRTLPATARYAARLREVVAPGSAATRRMRTRATSATCPAGWRSARCCAASTA